jgi:hypothetical protein
LKLREASVVHQNWEAALVEFECSVDVKDETVWILGRMRQHRDGRQPDPKRVRVSSVSKDRSAERISVKCKSDCVTPDDDESP